MRWLSARRPWPFTYFIAVIAVPSSRNDGVPSLTGASWPHVFRVTLGAGRALGPGKIRLLELIRDTGSISAAGRELGMSYRRAWLLVDDMNRTFRGPVVATKLGGKAGGGASLTPFGEGLVARYRLMANLADAALREHLDSLEAATAPIDGAAVGGSGHDP